jgi:hypothetical protein
MFLSVHFSQVSYQCTFLRFLSSAPLSGFSSVHISKFVSSALLSGFSSVLLSGFSSVYFSKIFFIRALLSGL